MNTLFWSKIQRGDEGAFRQLYEQYADLLYGYGMKIAGDETLVTEAVQSLSAAHRNRWQTVRSLTPGNI